MTILVARDVGDPQRIVYAKSIARAAALPEVAAAIAAYGASGAVFVERVDNLYRWSPATRGGPYALLRTIASFLDCDQHDLTVGFDTIDGWCIVGEPSEERANRCAVIENAPTTSSGVARTIEDRLAQE